MPRIDEGYRQEVTSKLVAALKNGTAPWQKPWTDRYMPVNAITGRHYSGINSIFLSIEGERLSENCDPRWITAKQAGKKGWLIKSGAKPVIISCIFFPEAHQDDVEINGLGCPIRRMYALFHASQIKGIPAFAVRERGTVIDNRMIDKIIFNSSARVYEGGFEACYMPSDDVIRMPNKNYFSSTEGYYSTLLHELVHWTGHRSRLDRITLSSNNFEAYAREELVAEIASIFLTAELGITQTQEHFEQHAAYVNYWIRLLESDPNAIFAAAKEARKAANYILMFKEVEIKLAS